MGLQPKERYFQAATLTSCFVMVAEMLGRDGNEARDGDWRQILFQYNFFTVHCVVSGFVY